ncbi:MAG: hypothetical protein EPO68_10025 [Planctomycetota bacterium]|nr:MAG: hypothetical protein EPO68_10025 [Planctomycetota bacterium]
MTVLRLALLADGPSDRALLPIISWCMRTLAPASTFFQPEFEVRHGDLEAAIESVLAASVPHVLFVHRDAERASLTARQAEIPGVAPGLVRVVPVRMTEAWLLTDEVAIRRAAGNPNGSVELDLPRPNKLESLPDPKAILRSLLIRATEFSSPRRKRSFERDIAERARLVAEYTDDFSALRALQAFQAFEAELRGVLSTMASP